MKNARKREGMTTEPRSQTPQEHRKAFMDYLSGVQAIVGDVEQHVEVPDDLDGEADFVVYVDRERIDDVQARLLDLSYELSAKYGVTLSSVVLPRLIEEMPADAEKRYAAVVGK